MLKLQVGFTSRKPRMLGYLPSQYLVPLSAIRLATLTSALLDGCLVNGCGVRGTSEAIE